MSNTVDTEVRRPGRPPQFDRDHALTSLCLLLWSKGYDGATQEEMLAATGLSASSLYRTFGTKADILEAALARYLAWADEMFAPLEHGHHGVSDVRAFFDYFQAQLDSPLGNAGCLVWNTMQNTIGADPRIKTLTERHMQRLREGLAAALQRAADAKELPATAPKRLADALRAGVLGVQARARAGDTADARALLDGIKALLDHDEP
ncbi:TetR family transcriptional regulator [Mycobacteroides stephanolepidis]|uniref:TetR family transcriptional regulator n=1 Tax=[Mycobacterium] stephanolepidis TaxID=1520670 RepID=A0A1Z4EYT0_9MYCO|nr:TetR/AcrR family transcriptional regulator [[Mycobacterium] stephanolepidis]BAX98135.1 TetR family transcriptional regulator [[Mycobacterium] stephanolepidis]